MLVLWYSSYLSNVAVFLCNFNSCLGTPPQWYVLWDALNSRSPCSCLAPQSWVDQLCAITDSEPWPPSYSLGICSHVSKSSLQIILFRILQDSSRACLLFSAEFLMDKFLFSKLFVPNVPGMLLLHHLQFLSQQSSQFTQTVCKRLPATSFSLGANLPGSRSAFAWFFFNSMAAELSSYLLYPTFSSPSTYSLIVQHMDSWPFCCRI